MRAYTRLFVPETCVIIVQHIKSNCVVSRTSARSPSHISDSQAVWHLCRVPRQIITNYKYCVIERCVCTECVCVFAKALGTAFKSTHCAVRVVCGALQSQTLYPFNARRIYVGSFAHHHRHTRTHTRTFTSSNKLETHTHTHTPHTLRASMHIYGVKRAQYV